MRAQRTTVSEGKAPTAAQYSGAGKPDHWNIKYLL